jgi:hypothetical protein
VPPVLLYETSNPKTKRTPFPKHKLRIARDTCCSSLSNHTKPIFAGTVGRERRSEMRIRRFWREMQGCFLKRVKKKRCMCNTYLQTRFRFDTLKIRATRPHKRHAKGAKQHLPCPNHPCPSITWQAGRRVASSCASTARPPVLYQHGNASPRTLSSLSFSMLNSL